MSEWRCRVDIPSFIDEYIQNDAAYRKIPLRKAISLYVEIGADLWRVEGVRHDLIIDRILDHTEKFEIERVEYRLSQKTKDNVNYVKHLVKSRNKTSIAFIECLLIGMLNKNPDLRSKMKIAQKP